jgi:hypothetical protein
MEEKEVEIKKLDFKNLDPKQEKELHALLRLIASRVATGLDALECDKDKVTVGCLCGQCCPDISINQLIEEVKNLSHRGLDYMSNAVSTMILVEKLHQEKYQKSWRYKWEKFLSSKKKK